MFRSTSALAALLFAVFAAGCATPQATNDPAAKGASEPVAPKGDPGDYTTGSRLPRK